MKKLTFIFFLIFSVFSFCEPISDKWERMHKKCELALIDGELAKARKLALELNKMDPSDTLVMYIIVLTSVELNIPLPKWLLEQPWPNTTEQDIKNYHRAMDAIKGK